MKMIVSAKLGLSRLVKNFFEVLWMAMWALTALSTSAEQEGDFAYLDNGPSITITAYTGSGGAVTIPDAILGKPITSIGDTAFSWTGVSSITIGNRVTNIEGYAFDGCINLTNVTIGNRVTTIGRAVFSGCASLASVTIPDSVTSIGQMAFQGCIGLANVTIGNSVSRLESGAFNGCQNLTSVVIGSAVTSIAIPYIHWGPMPWSVPGAFSGCTGLRTLYFLGNAPGDESELAFQFGDHATIFYRAGATGWGSTFGGRPTLLWTATDDLDHDRVNNLEEMLAGTDPLDARSLLAFESAPRPEALVEMDQTAIPAGQHALYFQSIPGNRYEILASERLGGTWASLATVDAAALQKRVLVDKPANAAFYRIQVAR